MVLESILNKLSAQNWIDATKKKSLERDAQTNADNLMDLKVSINAVLAETDLRIRDFIGMEVGDVLTTDHRITQDIEGFIGNRKKIIGRPGLVGKKRGFVVTEVISPLGKEL